MSMADLITVNPELDRPALAEEFARSGRVQVPDVLTIGSAMALRHLLEKQTPWLVTWSAGSNGARYIPGDQLARMSPQEKADIESAILAAGRRNEFCYLYLSYPLDTAHANKWQPGSPQEHLRDELRGDAFASLLRDLSGEPGIVGADGYLTHFAPGHFLSLHSDEGSKWPRVVAYVLNLTFEDWQPDYGGYLTFFDDRGDVEAAFMPRFNSLNVFAVPQLHSVSKVAPFAPMGRAAISGWARKTLEPVAGEPA
jgi:Rps23 Pro-64 3,4-dihydroxylase Tpa1-like proline 4-hydroxylase